MSSEAFNSKMVPILMCQDFSNGTQLASPDFLILWPGVCISSLSLGLVLRGHVKLGSGLSGREATL